MARRSYRYPPILFSFFLAILLPWRNAAFSFHLHSAFTARTTRVPNPFRPPSLRFSVAVFVSFYLRLYATLLFSPLPTAPSSLLLRSLSYFHSCPSLLFPPFCFSPTPPLSPQFFRKTLAPSVLPQLLARLLAGTLPFLSFSSFTLVFTIDSSPFPLFYNFWTFLTS